MNYGNDWGSIALVKRSSTIFAKAIGIVILATYLQFVVSVGSNADNIPGFSSSSLNHFYTKLTKVDVEFSFDSKRVDNPTKLSIPLAYIYAADRAVTKDRGPIRDNIIANFVAVRFMDQSGKAYPIALREYRRENGQYSDNEAAEKIRKDVVGAVLKVFRNPDFPALLRARPTEWGVRQSDVDGLTHYLSDRGSRSYFPGSDTDSFVSADCPNPTNPDYFCQYYVIISDNIYAKIAFVDFRVNGGREWANNRINFAKGVIASFFAVKN